MHALGLAILTAALPAALLTLPHDWRFLPLHAGLVGATLMLARRAPAIDRLLAAKPALRWGLMAGGAVLVTASLFGEVPRATWGVIDDHAIHTLIGPGRDRLPPKDVVPMLVRHPEFGSPTASQTRYRPAYYAFYLGQAAAFGKDPWPWFAVRLALCALTATLAFDLLRRWLGMVAGATALACFAALWMWFDIFGRLGSGETYAAPASVAFVWWTVEILEARGRAGWLPWIGLVLSALVAIGSKENFVILAPLTLLVAAIDRRHGARSWAGAVASAVVCAAAAVVIGVVAVGIANNGGRDVYQRSVGLAGLLDIGDPAARRTLRKLVTYGLPLAAGCVGAAIGWARAPHTAAGARRRRWCGAAAILCVAALSQVAFYRGDVFKKCRYDLPLVPIVGTLAIGLVAAAAQVRYGPDLLRHARRRLLVPGALAVGALALGGDHTRAATHAYVRDTTLFYGTVRDIAAACRAGPTRPVVFVVPGDPKASYEPLLSTAAYLRSCGVANPLHLDGDGFMADHVAAGASWQARELAEVRRSGGGDFQPAAQLGRDTDPIEVWFAADPPLGRDGTFRVQ